MVNLELYRIFKIVAEEENITYASEKLNISQPAVTKHIQNLEKLLNVKLFERTNKGLSLTEDGRNIFNNIKEPIATLESISKKYNSVRVINLGVHATLLNKLLSKKISEYYNINSNVKINIVNIDTTQMLAKLEKKEIDIVISKKSNDYDMDKLEFIEIGNLHDILVVNGLSDLLKRIINIDELKEQIIYMPRKTSVTCSNFFKSLDLNESDFKNIRNISYNTMIEIVKDTECVGLMTKEYIKNELETKQVMELQTSFQISPIEYGIYVNKDNKFKELSQLIRLIEN